MQSQLDPYLSFKDNVREAMGFYKTVFGGAVCMDTFEEFHVSQDPTEDHKNMDSMLRAENGIVSMAADTPNSMQYHSEMNISMSLSGDNEVELSTYYEKHSPGGMKAVQLAKAPWGDTFGMCVDKFGASGMVNIAGPKS